jgi:hypothetical protein
VKIELVGLTGDGFSRYLALNADYLQKLSDFPHAPRLPPSTCATWRTKTIRCTRSRGG